ncbi:supernatant protein factor C-terminal domain-containing protein [Blastocladiella britannica]|nr:supernatant protein factor C-terminal domain-containing protein [Blastocladiella britannica]
MHSFGVLVALLALMVTVATALTIRVPPYEQQCFFEELVKDQRLSITYQVGDGGQLDVDFWVTDPTGNILHIINKESTGSHDFRAKVAGRYTYCFSNQMSSHYEKVLQFSVEGANAPPLDPKAIVDPVLAAITDLAKDVHSIKEEQQYVMIRERQHRETAEDINSRVMWWSIMQVMVLVGVCLFQVYYLRHFFEVKRMI